MALVVLKQLQQPVRQQAAVPYLAPSLHLAAAVVDHIVHLLQPEYRKAVMARLVVAVHKAIFHTWAIMGAREIRHLLARLKEALVETGREGLRLSLAAAAAGLRPLDQRQALPPMAVALVVREPHHHFLAAASLMLVVAEEGSMKGHRQILLALAVLVAAVLVLPNQTMALRGLQI